MKNFIYRSLFFIATILFAISCSKSDSGSSGSGSTDGGTGVGIELEVTKFEMKKPNSNSYNITLTVDKNNKRISYNSLLQIDVTRLTPYFTVLAANNGKPIEYTLKADDTVLKNGETVLDMRLPKKLTLSATVDGKAYSKEYSLAVNHLDTGLPVVYFDTNSGREINTKDYYADCTIVIDGRGQYENMPLTPIVAKGRGNVSWTRFLKKSYAFKFEKRTEVMGMPKHKRWSFIGNYRDKTLMRNMVSMELGKCTDLKWNPRYVQTELVYNGKHMGTYMISELIRIDKNRVDINEMTPEQTTLPDISGGYILEWEQYADDEKYMEVMPRTGKQLYVKIPNLEDGNQAQFDYIIGYMKTIEELLYQASKAKEGPEREAKFVDIFNKYIDVDSFVDTWMVYEISGTSDFSVPRSHHMYKDKDDPKIYAGPLWDFDMGTFIPGHQNKWVNREATWYKYLFTSSTFKSHVKKHWYKHKEGFYKVLNFIDEQQRYLRESAQINWQITDLKKTNESSNGDEYIPSDEAIERMRTSLKNKLDYMESRIKNYKDLEE